MSFSNSVLNIRYIITNTHCFAINIPADFVPNPLTLLVIHSFGRFPIVFAQ